MPTRVPTSFRRLVMFMSAWLGVGVWLGWLWAIISPAALSAMASANSSRGWTKDWFRVPINERLKYLKTRKDYADFAATLMRVSKTYEGGEEFIGRIYRRAKEIYKKRPAFIEELSILSHLDKETPKKQEKKEVEQKSLF